MVGLVMINMNIRAYIEKDFNTYLVLVIIDDVDLDNNYE